MTPLSLVGKNLGQRHQCLNNAVNEALRIQAAADLDAISEYSPIDRIFKIKLASKTRDVDYIIKNLKDDDLLYVSNALESKWLLDAQYEHIMNPEYLESQLYPCMITTAVTKIKHWIYLNLKDSERCQRFYIFYCDTNFNYAIKFLRTCSAKFIEQEFPKQVHKLSLHDFKILCETNSRLAQIFFDTLHTDEELKEKYLSKEKQYFSILKSLLKINSNMVLDITEKYFNAHIMRPFNAKATKFIMQHQRARVDQKPALYAAVLLDLDAMSGCLSSEHATTLLFTLARDNRLISQSWFNYKKVEPLIKRIKHEDRGAIKKKVFVDKDIGNIINEWTYEMPSSPTLAVKITPIFRDYERRPSSYSEPMMDFRKMLKKRKYAKWASGCASSNKMTMLDKLFNEYRVTSYERTLYELRKKLKAESSPQNRQYMMLVLVSKSGGHDSNLSSMMDLLSFYKNEPAQIRATVVRSLVKRARVWHAASDTWNKLLEFSHGLGLDGWPPEADCVEGIHAAVIRQILLDNTCSPEIFSAYLDNFSTLKQYSISKEETEVISNVLPKMLYVKISEAIEACDVEKLLNRLLDTLVAFKIPVKEYPGLISKVESLASNHTVAFSGILNRLFNSKIARRELFRVNFEIIQTEDSYLNALRHDINIISIQKLLKLISDCKVFDYQRFFSKLSIYFNESNGLSRQFLSILQKEPHQKVFVKPLTLLLGEKLMAYLNNIDSTTVDKKDKSYAAAIRSNLHLARPVVDVDACGWSFVGTKAAANKISICRTNQIQNYVQKLQQNKQTITLAYIIAKRMCNDLELHCLTTMSKIKPNAALKLGLKKLIHDKKIINPAGYWDVTQFLLQNFDVDADSKKYIELPDVSDMPDQFKPAYCMVLTKIYMKKSIYKCMPIICHIENHLPDILENFIEHVINEFLNKGLPGSPEEYDRVWAVHCTCLYIRLIVKYILLSPTEETQTNRLEHFGTALLGKFDTWLHSDAIACNRYLDEVLKTFPYYKVYFCDQYVTCQPVLRKILNWMKQNIPIESNLKQYIHIHLNMLYYNAISESIAALPSVDDDNQMELRRMVGNIFGKYVAREIDELKNCYFDSIQNLYKDAIVDLNVLPSCEVFLASFLGGLVKGGRAGAVLAALLLGGRHALSGQLRRDIIHRLTQCDDMEIQFILSSHMSSSYATWCY